MVTKHALGHGNSSFIRHVNDVSHRISETFQSIDEATGGAASEAVSSAVNLIPGVNTVRSAINTGKKAFAAVKGAQMFLKRQRQEGGAVASRADADPFRKRRRVVR